MITDVATMLFVPGDRPDRFAKAAAAGAGLVMLDLEDAVASDRKDVARDCVVEWLAAGHKGAVRINPAGTPWHDADLGALAPYQTALMIPKAEPATLPERLGLIALVETARGVLSVADIAAAPGVRRLAFGSFDLSTELGVDPTDRDALAPARGALVYASAAAGLAGPIDGVTGNLEDDAILTSDVRYARRLGFTGKLCVHPRQVAVANTGLRPDSDQLRWAQEVVAAARRGAVAANGHMIDKPVVARAQRIVRQAEERIAR